MSGRRVEPDGRPEAGRPSLKRLDRPARLSEQAYERIRAELLSGGRLSRVGRLVERDVARRLSMSRTPVRDALRRLASEGLIEPAGAGGGYVRRRPSVRDVRECYELRLLLEPVAAALAARRPRTSGGPAGRSDAEFHTWVAEASGNPVLARALRAVDDRLAVVGEETPIDSAASQRAVLDAVRRQAPDAAAEAMRAHLRLELELLEAALRTAAVEAGVGR
jgi:DNA-binding GntR family transcriptional regulator